MDLNPHKRIHPPLLEAPDGMIWFGVYPNVKLITMDELSLHIRETLGKQSRSINADGDGGTDG